jgi:hypothetical protein
MIRSKMIRLAAVGALAGSAALALTPAGVAGAAGSIKCSSMTGNIAKKVTLSGCTGNTGGSSKPIASTALATGGVIKWANGKKTTVTLTATAKGTACPAGSSEYQAKGKVTKDTTGSAAVGGTIKGNACVNGKSGAITLVPGTKLTI